VVGLALIVYGTFPGESSILPILLGQLIGGAGFSIALSADGGLLRQVASDMDQKALGAIQAKAQSWMFIATLLAGFCGGILFDHQPHWALFAGILASIFAIATIVAIIAGLQRENSNASPQSAEVKHQQANNSLLVLDENQTIWIGFYSITRAFALAPFIGLLPLHFSLQQVDPYLFGIVLGIFTLGGFLVALYGAPVLARWGLKGTLVSLLGIILSLGIFALSDFLESVGISYFTSSLVGISLLGIAAGAIRPSVMSCLDVSNLSPFQRISVFSMMERNFGYLCASLLVVFGFLVENYSITMTFMIAVIMLIAILALGGVWLKFFFQNDMSLSARTDEKTVTGI
jgi:MFS family permease